MLLPFFSKGIVIFIEELSWNSQKRICSLLSLETYEESKIGRYPTLVLNWLRSEQVY